ncbi:prolyl oligopeptidase family serine peptidase [Chitinophaga sp. Hz27]|uniref:alpha/beta hydrolase family protein n=1 Tax=Chitinophaga sp. Hz27 TaxID=3347169 RepID=UPI0035E20D4D
MLNKRSIIGISCLVRFLLFTLIITLQYNSATSQKLIIDTSAYHTWSFIDAPQFPLSSTGNYITYRLTKDDGRSRTNYIASTNDQWMYQINDGSIQFITHNSTEYALIRSNDSTYLLNLSTKEKKNIPLCQKIDFNGSILQYRKTENATCIAYTDTAFILHILYLSSLKSITVGKVIDFRFSEDGKMLLVISPEKENELTTNQIDVYNVNRYEKLSQLKLDEKVSQLNPISKIANNYYLMANSQNGIQTNNILYKIHPGSNLIANIFSSKLLDSLMPGSKMEDYFFNVTSDDRKILFYLSPNQTTNTYERETNISLSILSYRDSHIYADKQKVINYTRLSTYDLQTHRIEILEDDTTSVLANKNGDWIVLGSHHNIRDVNHTRYYDERDIKRFGYNLITGKKIPIQISNNKDYDLYGLRDELSPNSTKYIVFSYDDNTYYIHDLPSGKVIDLKCPSDLNKAEMESNHSFIHRVAGWSKDNDTVYLYARRDIWMASTQGKFPGKNITNGLGNKSNVKFDFLTESNIIDPRKDTILLALNINTKENGFYKLQSNTDPLLLTMQPKLFFADRASAPLAVRGSRSQVRPQKASESNLYAVSSESASESLNYYITRDFVHFKQITFNYPERKYNWLTSHLYEWNFDSQKKMQGVLYLPENFDSAKKYPVIVYCYEQMSDGLNGYIPPTDLLSGCAMNIPSYVSNGYIVLCPDLYLPKGNTFVGAASSIKSSVEKLRTMTYIDSMKIGIQGCSFGGLITDFVITQTNLFRAACAASGVANLISVSNDFDGRNVSNISMYENGQVRMGILWQNQQGYLNNTAILHADKVTTPLLIMHTTGDKSCPLYDAMQYYNALKYNEKKVWLLQYHGSHGVDGADATDFSNRMKDYFDYFLKDKGNPKWITTQD